MSHSPRFKAWAAVAVYAAMIFFLSSLSFPFPQIGKVEKYHYDWLLHMIEYLVFGWLIARAFDFSADFPNAWALGLAAFALASLYGVSDEWHQSFVPYRDPSAADWIADSIGAVNGIVFYLKRSRKNA